MLAQLDEDAVVETTEDGTPVDHLIQNPKKAHRYSAIFDLKTRNNRVEFGRCYVFTRWLCAPLCGCTKPSGELPNDPTSRKAALFAKYLEFINEEIHDEKDRIDQLRSYEVIAHHLSHKRLSDYGDVYDEVFKYMSTISWDPNDKSARLRLSMIEAVTQEVSLAR